MLVCFFSPPHFHSCLYGCSWSSGSAARFRRGFFLYHLSSLTSPPRPVTAAARPTRRWAYRLIAAALVVASAAQRAGSWHPAASASSPCRVEGMTASEPSPLGSLQAPPCQWDCAHGTRRLHGAGASKSAISGRFPAAEPVVMIRAGSLVGFCPQCAAAQGSDAARQASR